MKIIVAHDRIEVAREIETLISGLNLGAVQVDIAGDGQTTNRLLRERLYDLLILDLTLPYLSGQMAPSLDVAESLLRELFTRDTFNPPGDVIGLTADPEALAAMTSSVGPHLMAMIAEDVEGRWRTYLRDRIIYAARGAQSRQFSTFRHHAVDALILTALDEELEAYGDHLELQEHKRYPGAYSFMFRDIRDEIRSGVAFSVGRSGQPRCASRMQSLLSVFRPRLALMTGFCGGFQGKADPGELLIFEVVHDWDYGKWQDRSPPSGSVDPVPTIADVEFVTRAVPLTIDETRARDAGRRLIASDFVKNEELLRRLSEASDGELVAPSVSFAQVASGSTVVAHDSIISHIRGLNDAIKGVDMESYGFYHAAQHTHVVRPEALCMKAVADHANPAKDDKWHDTCSMLSASAAMYILNNIWDFDA